MQSHHDHRVRTGIIPMRALRKLHEDAKKGDDEATALTNLIGNWWYGAQLKMHCEHPDDIIACAGCFATLNEGKVGGFAVMVPLRLVRGEGPKPGHCVAFCLNCMSRPPAELHEAFAKVLEFNFGGKLERH